MLLDFLRSVESLSEGYRCPACGRPTPTIGGHGKLCILANMIRQLEGQRRGVGSPPPQLHSTNPELGLYDKFEVIRADGDVKRHSKCRYFVLDLTHDDVARIAAWEYAEKAGSLLGDELNA